MTKNNKSSLSSATVVVTLLTVVTPACAVDAPPQEPAAAAEPSAQTSVGLQSNSSIVEWLEDAADTYEVNVVDKLRANSDADSSWSWISRQITHATYMGHSWIVAWMRLATNTLTTGDIVDVAGTEDDKTTPVKAGASLRERARQSEADLRKAESEITVAQEEVVADAREARDAMEIELEMRRAKVRAEIERRRQENERRIEEGLKKLEQFEQLDKAKKRAELTQSKSSTDQEGERALPTAETQSPSKDAQKEMEAARLAYINERAEAERDYEVAQKRVQASQQSAFARAKADALRLAFKAEMTKAEEDRLTRERKLAEQRREDEKRQAKLEAQRLADQAEIEAQRQAAEARRLARLDSEKSATKADSSKTAPGNKAVPSGATEPDRDASVEAETKPSPGTLSDSVKTMAEEGARNATVAIESALARLSGASQKSSDESTPPDPDASKTSEKTNTSSETDRKRSQSGIEGAPSDTVGDSPSTAKTVAVAKQPVSQNAEPVPDLRKPTLVPETESKGNEPQRLAKASTEDVDDQQGAATSPAEKAKAVPVTKTWAKKRYSKKRSAKKRSYKRKTKKYRYSKKSKKRKARYRSRKKPRYYRIARGDTLSGIAKRFLGTPRGAKAIYLANRRRLKSIHRIRAGQRIRIPRYIR